MGFDSAHRSAHAGPPWTKGSCARTALRLHRRGFPPTRAYTGLGFQGAENWTERKQDPPPRAKAYDSEPGNDDLSIFLQFRDRLRQAGESRGQDREPAGQSPSFPPELCKSTHRSQRLEAPLPYLSPAHNTNCLLDICRSNKCRTLIATSLAEVGRMDFWNMASLSLKF